jgi:hypothetical protein
LALAGFIKQEKLQYIKSNSNLPGKLALAALLVGVILFLDALAASPALHEWFHHDADKPGHHCAVTTFAHGKVDSVTVDVPVAVPTTTVETTTRIQIFVFSPVIADLPHGRAPPFLCP